MQQKSKLSLAPKGGGTSSSGRVPRVTSRDVRVSSSFHVHRAAMRLTQTLEDEHTDCTHYCLDSGVHDAVLDAVAFELSVRVRR